MPSAQNLKRTFSLLAESTVRIDFLLPNGLVLTLEIDSDLSLSSTKDELWSVANREPLFDILQPKDRYIFEGINRETAEPEEYYDQSLRVRELPLLLPCLRLVEATKDSNLLEKNVQDAVISSCIGVSHADLDQAEIRIPEVKWARTRLRQLALMHRTALLGSGPSGLAQHLTSAPQREVSRSLKAVIDRLPFLTISAWILDGEQSAKERRVIVELSLLATVFDTLARLLQLQTELVRNNKSLAANPELTVNIKPPEVSAYLLKVCCSQDYLFDFNARLTSYAYVQQCVEQNRNPCLSPVLRQDAYDSLVRTLSNSPTDRFSFQTTSRPNSDVPVVPPRSPRLSSKCPMNENEFFSVKTPKRRLHQSDLGSQNGMSAYQALEDFARYAKDKTETEECEPLTGDSISVDPSENNAKPVPKARSRKPSVVSLWKLTGFLSIQVRSAKFVAGAEAGGQSTAPGSPTTQRAALVSTFAASLDVSQSSYIVRVGLFHGSQSLIECQSTGEMPGTRLTWNKSLNFHVLWADIPPAARLCVALLKVEKTSDKRTVKQNEYPVGWANLNFFDHRGFMISGDIVLRLWPASLLQSTEDQFNRLYPAGTVLDNPNPDFTVQVRIHNPTQKHIRLPHFHTYVQAGERRSISSVGNVDTFKSCRNSIANLGFTNQVFGDMEEDVEAGALLNRTQQDIPQLFHTGYGDLSEADLLETEADRLESLLRELVTRDPLYELSEQEKSAVWKGRYFCLKNLPETLPWLTQSVCWHRRESLVEFYHLLHSWPRPLTVGLSLQLLGAMGLNVSGATETTAVVHSAAGSSARGGASGVADAHVRELAISSLYCLSDSELADYLLQLVQAVKSEAYLDNPLSRFLLFRSLRNPTLIGLRFFWHLRSEIHMPDIRLKFGLLLEAFCLGCGPLLTFLSRQVTALNRLEAISVRVKELASEEEQRTCFRQEVSKPEARLDLQWLPSPLSLSERLGELVISKCDVKRSKKRPLWLVWTNSDRLGTHHLTHYQMIFKHGDDLRQDMLTLQLLRVMDRIWKDEGLDLCLVPYGCIATGQEMGLIEAVRHARTVMSIQGDRLRSALQIDSTQLYKWLTQSMKPGENSETYERLIRNFTLSCAGYCVATFVLGIRDRHPDNIMVDTSGRLFHIDFGHILDNRKKKFGITRERVPFVLTKDFITVIVRGNPDVVLSSPATATAAASTPDISGTGSGNVHFQDFTNLCCRAYLMLRKHANLLLTLFAMMLPSGLPELTSLCDLEYVRKTLAVEMSEQEALAYFYTKFTEAYYGAWTTKIDWFGHWINT